MALGQISEDRLRIAQPERTVFQDRKLAQWVDLEKVGMFVRPAWVEIDGDLLMIELEKTEQ